MTADTINFSFVVCCLHILSRTENVYFNKKAEGKKANELRQARIEAITSGAEQIPDAEEEEDQDHNWTAGSYK